MNYLTVVTDINELDISMIHEFLSNSYWGKGRNREETVKSIENSMNFGLFKKGRQIGYTRVVTDHIYFAYLFDVFIIEAERGNGYGKFLMEKVLHHSVLKDVKHWKLTTADAHSLYEHYGFKLVAHPEWLMEWSREG